GDYKPHDHGLQPENLQDYHSNSGHICLQFDSSVNDNCLQQSKSNVIQLVAREPSAALGRIPFMVYLFFFLHLLRLLHRLYLRLLPRLFLLRRLLCLLV
ncbi:hypothetical protein L9F63_019922, partial [Diploptera punctata]